MLHPENMKSKVCAVEKQQDFSQGLQLSQKSSLLQLAWRTWFRTKMTELENQTGTRAEGYLEPDDDQFTAPGFSGCIVI